MANVPAKPTKNYYESYGEQAAGTRNIVGQLLKFNKFGEFKAGQENTDVPIGTQMIAYVPSLLAGWIRWEDNKPAEHLMGTVGTGFVAPVRSELSDQDESLWEKFDNGQPKDPWQFSNYMILVDYETQEQLYTFTTASKGGIGAIGELTKIYGKHIRSAPNDLPVVTLTVGSYMHSNKAFGEIRFPQFNLVGWVEPPPALQDMIAAAQAEAAAQELLEDQSEETEAEALAEVLLEAQAAEQEEAQAALAPEEEAPLKRGTLKAVGNGKSTVKAPIRSAVGKPAMGKPPPGKPPTARKPGRI